MAPRLREAMARPLRASPGLLVALMVLAGESQACWMGATRQ